jgi:hypothetical protein
MDINFQRITALKKESVRKSWQRSAMSIATEISKPILLGGATVGVPFSKVRPRKN